MQHLSAIDTNQSTVVHKNHDMFDHKERPLIISDIDFELAFVRDANQKVVLSVITDH